MAFWLIGSARQDSIYVPVDKITPVRIASCIGQAVAGTVRGHPAGFIKILEQFPKLLKHKCLAQDSVDLFISVALRLDARDAHSWLSSLPGLRGAGLTPLGLTKAAQVEGYVNRVEEFRSQFAGSRQGKITFEVFVRSSNPEQCHFPPEPLWKLGGRQWAQTGERLPELLPRHWRLEAASIGKGACGLWCDRRDGPLDSR
jgi:hypothetical protein